MPNVDGVNTNSAREVPDSLTEGIYRQCGTLMQIPDQICLDMISLFS